MSKSKSGKSAIFPAIISFIIVTIAWAGYRLFIEPALTKSLNSNILIWVEITVKSIVLIVPAIFLINIYKSELGVSRKNIFGWNNKNFLYAGSFAMLFAMFYAIRQYIDKGTSGYDFSLITFPILMTTIICAGFTEEIFFRGWFLNALLKKMDFGFANVLTALAFTLLHYPIWFNQGHFQNIQTILSVSLSTFVIGYILGYIAHKEESIWGAVFVHSMHNLLVTTLIMC